MQPESSSTIHPTRTAPLCTACAHYLPPRPMAAPLQFQLQPARCNHPGSPVSPITGEAVATVDAMRADEQTVLLEDRQSIHCGQTAQLFEARAAASEDRKEPPTPHELAAWRARGYGLVQLHPPGQQKAWPPTLLWAYEDLQAIAAQHGQDSPEYRAELDACAADLKPVLPQLVEAAVNQGIAATAPAAE